MKIDWKIIRIITLVLGGGLLLLLSKDDCAFEFVFGTIENKKNIQYILFFTGLVISPLWAGIENIFLRKNKESINEKFSELIELYKKDKIKDLEFKLSGDFKLKVRLFIPEKGLIPFIKEVFNKGKSLKMTDVKGLTDKYEAKHITFKVFNKDLKNDDFEQIIKKEKYNLLKTQGMVGTSYLIRDIITDFDVNSKDKHGKKQYTLTKSQDYVVGNIVFCSTIPIFDIEKDKVLAILSIDSVDKIKWEDNDMKIWEEQIRLFVSFIDKNIKL